MAILYETYAKSPERAIAAVKRPTRAGLSLWDEARTTRVEDTTQFVGTKLTINITLHELVDGVLSCKSPEFYPNITTVGRKLDVYHRVNAGAWEKIATVTIELGCGVDIFYTLTKAGTHDFYAEFGGTAYLEGCRKAARTFAR